MIRAFQNYLTSINSFGFESCCSDYGQFLKFYRIAVCMICIFFYFVFHLVFSAERVPLQEILLKLSNRISTKQQSKCNINRSAVWEGMLCGF